MEPSDIDLFDDKVGWRTQYRELCDRLMALSRFVQELRRHAYEEDPILPQFYGKDFMCYADQTAVRAEIKRQFDLWSETLFANEALMHEVRHYDGKHDSFGMHIFLELTQLNAQLARPALVMERENLATIAPENLTDAPLHYNTLYSMARTTHPLWVELLATFECPPIRAGEDHDGQDVDRVNEMQKRMKRIWNQPLLEITQADTRMLILFLTQQLHQLRCCDAVLMSEYRRVFNLLWLRIAQLLNQAWPGSVLDDEVRSADGKNEVLETMRHPLGSAGQDLYAFNRHYVTFCYFYMGEIQRCLFHYDMLKARPAITGCDGAALGAKAFDWLTRIVMAYADDAFEEMYATRAVQRGYQFVGDDNWFRYMWPNKVHSRGACVTQIRPNLYRSFYSEANLSKRVVLANAGQGDYVATLFVLQAMHEYLRIATPRCSWLTGCVIDADGIDQSAYLLRNPLCPVLLQVVSFWWVYDASNEQTGAQVYITDNVYEAIGVFFWVLHTRYNNKLYDVDMSMYMPEILTPPGRPAPAWESINVNDFEL